MPSQERSYYDAFEHLSDALCWNIDDLVVIVCPVEQQNQSAYTAHFDDSGSQDAGEFFVVGGYISEVGRWKEFDKGWHDVLAGVPYFRSAEFFPSTGHFAKWKNDRLAHDTFNMQLIDLQLKHAKRVFVVAVPLSIWHRVNRKYELAESNLWPYVLCGLDCVRRVQEWRSATFRSTFHIRFIFESGTKHWGHLQEWIDKEFGFKPIPGEKLEVFGLQGADYLAWQVNTLCKRLHRVDSNRAIQESLESIGEKAIGARDGLRKDYNALIKGIYQDDFLWSLEELTDLCIKERIPVRK